MAFAGLSMSNVVLTGSATLNGTNVADQAFVSNVVAASAADKASTGYVASAVATGIVGVAYSSDVQTNLLAVSNNVRVAVTSEIAARYTSYESLLTNVTVPTLIGLYYTQLWDRASAAIGASSNYAVSVSNNLQPQINLAMSLATSNLFAAVAAAAASNYNAYASFLTNSFVPSLIGLSNSFITADIASKAGGASNYAVVASNNLAARAEAIRVASAAYTAAVSNYLWTALSNYTYTVSNNLGAVDSADRATAYAYTYGVSNWLQNVIDNAVAGLSVTDTTNRTYLASLLGGPDSVAVSHLTIPATATGTYNFAVSVSSSAAPTGVVDFLSMAPRDKFRVTVPLLYSNGVSLGNVAFSDYTAPWFVPLAYPLTLAYGGVIGDRYNGMGDQRISFQQVSATLVVAYSDWSSGVPPFYYLATNTYPLAALTNEVFRLYSSVPGYTGTVVVSTDYLLSGTQNVSRIPLQDPFPSIALASNRANSIVTGAAVVSNKVSFSLFTNCVRLVTLDTIPVVSYIAVSNGALVVLPAPPTAP